MNIHQLSLKARVPLNALRRLEKLKVLKIDPEPDISAVLRFNMRGATKLSVPNLLALIGEPDTIDTLGRFADSARAQLDALGDYEGQSAPPDVTAYIIDAGRGNPKAAAVLAQWARSILPRDNVDYAWLAVRLLLPLPIALREQCTRLTTLAMLNVRKLPEFEGYWHAANGGKGKTIRYHAHRQFTMDL